MTMTEKTETTEPQLIPRLDRNLAVTNYRPGGMGDDNEIFTCNLTLDGKVIARVVQGGYGGPNSYTFESGAAQREYEAWASRVTGGAGDPLDSVVDFLIDIVKLNKHAARFAKSGFEGAILILREPLMLREGEKPNPYGSIFDDAVFMALEKLTDAERVAREERALFYMVSDPLPPGAVVPKERVDKEEAGKHAKKWRRKDPTVRAAVLIRKGEDERGRIYPVRTEADVDRLVKEHGATSFIVSDYLPEASAEEVRAYHVGRLNNQLADWRLIRRDIIAAVLITTEKGGLMVSARTRDPEAIKTLIKEKGALSEEYFISDPLPEGQEDGLDALRSGPSRRGRGGSRKGGARKGRR